MPAVPDLPAERGPEQQAGPLNPEWRNDCPGRLPASWGHHRPHRRYGSGYPLVLLIVVRLNYMSALYFSSISFTAHKKHGGAWSLRPRTGLPPKSSSDMSEPPLRASRCGGSSVLRKDSGGNPVRGLRLLRGRRVYLGVLHIQSWKGLNCTLPIYALFPDGTVLEGRLHELR